MAIPFVPVTDSALSPRAKRIRLLLSGVVILLLLWGTFFGDDDNFPFGPFRMYSTKQELDGEVRAIEMYARDESGEWTRLGFSAFGTRPADIEGQLGKLAEPPERILGWMVEAYENIHDEPFPYEVLEIRQRTYDLEDGRSVGESVEALGTLEIP